MPSPTGSAAPRTATASASSPLRAGKRPVLPEPDGEQSFPILGHAKLRGHEYPAVDIVSELFEPRNNVLVNWRVTSTGHVRDILNKNCTWADFLYDMKKPLPEFSAHIMFRSDSFAD